MSFYGDEKHNVDSEYISPIGKYAVDIPHPDRIGPDGEWTNVYIATTKEEAIKWAMENLGSDENGMISIISSF